MAGIGLKNFRYAKLNEDGETYDEIKTLAGAIECKVALETVNAVLYADDQIKEEITEFRSGTITIGIDNDDDTIFAEILGKTIDVENGFVISNVNDTPILVGFGHVVPKIVGGKRKYKVEFFYKVKFKPFMTDAKTKGDSLEFTTPSVEATIFPKDNGDWENHHTFDTEAEANTALDALFVQMEG